MRVVSSLALIALLLPRVAPAQSAVPAWAEKAAQHWQNDHPATAPAGISLLVDAKDSGISEMYLQIGDSMVATVRPDKDGHAWLQLPAGRTYQAAARFRNSGRRRIALGEINLHAGLRRAGAAMLRVSLSQAGVASLLLEPVVTGRQGKGGPVVLTATIAALSAAPERIAPRSRPETLRTLKEEAFPKAASMDTVEKPAFPATAMAPGAPLPKPSASDGKPATTTAASAVPEMEESEASRFETDALPVDSDSPEVRRLWRMIGNAATPRLKAEAQKALGDYYRRGGDKTRAEISLLRARFWESRLP